MSALATAVLVVILMLVCAAMGGVLHKRLPNGHLEDETKSIALTGIGLLVTMASLAMSLLLGEAKGQFDRVANEVGDFAAKIGQLDAALREVGELALLIGSLSVARALLLVLEMNFSFRGIVHVSRYLFQHGNLPMKRSRRIQRRAACLCQVADPHAN